MASLRPYWKGHLKLSLVNIGVELYSATTSSGKIRLNQIHEPTGKRIRYEKVAEGVGPVDHDDIVKGFQVEKDEYVLLTPEELDEIKLESKRTINLVQFVDQHEIDPRYFEKPYYIIPADTDVANEGFAVIRDALKESGKTALGQIAARGRDHIIAIKPCGKGLLGETLRFAEEIRESDEVFKDIDNVKLEEELTTLAHELIERKSAPFKAEAFKSQYTESLRELIEEKRKSGTISSDEDSSKEESQSNVIDLMAALRKSVENDKASKKKSKASGKKKASSKKASKKSKKSSAA